MNIKDYKDKNKEVSMYIIGIILLYIYITNSYMINSNHIITINKLTTTTLFSSILYLFVYLSDSIVSSYFKDKVVYLFGVIRKPGECIFSNIKQNCKDDRILKSNAEKEYYHIYNCMPKEKQERKKYENAHWYSIYLKYRGEKMIQISHRDYLMSRDFVFITISILVIYIIFIIMGFISHNLIFSILLVGLIIINIISANIKAKRFTYNAIAIDLSKNIEK